MNQCMRAVLRAVGDRAALKLPWPCAIMTVQSSTCSWHLFIVQGSDSVVACAYKQASGRVEIEPSWNTGSPRNNRQLSTVRFIINTPSSLSSAIHKNLILVNYCVCAKIFGSFLNIRENAEWLRFLAHPVNESSSVCLRPLGLAVTFTFFNLLNL